MKTCGIKGLLNILSTYGSVTLYCIMFTYQGEELNHQHFLLGIASTTLLCEALLIAYVRKHKFDIIDVSIFVAYLYFIFMNEYNNALSDKSDIYSVQLFFVLYFAFRIILHCFHVKYILICLLAVTEIFQSLVGTGQFLGILDSRHTSFSVTGTFLNPGPFGIFLAELAYYLQLFFICRISKARYSIRQNSNAFSSILLLKSDSINFYHYYASIIWESKCFVGIRHSHCNIHFNDKAY